jgi:hypothetical protein
MTPDQRRKDMGLGCRQQVKVSSALQALIRSDKTLSVAVVAGKEIDTMLDEFGGGMVQGSPLKYPEK